MAKSTTALAQPRAERPRDDGDATASTPPAPTRWVWLAAWPVVAVFVLSNAATPLYVLWQREIGFSKGTLTVIFASYMVGLLASLLVSGVAADRWGRRPVLLPAIALALATCVIYATASSVAALVAARLLTGVAIGAVVSGGMAAVSDVAGPGRARLAALLASTGTVLGAGTGPLLAGVLSEALPAPTVTVFVVEAGLLVTALLTTLALPLRRPAAPASGAWVRVPRVPRGTGARLALGVAVFAPGLTATSFVVSLGPSLLASLLGSTSRVASGSLAFVAFASAALAQFAVRGLRRPTILVAGAVGTTASMVVLVVAVHTLSVPVLVAAAVLAGAGQGMGQLGGLSLLNSAVPPRRLAEANAALNVCGYVPAGALPVAAGYLSDAVGLTAGATTFGVFLALLAATGGVVVLAARRRLAEPA
ncbi:MFS transporter [Streptoalloteichus hindustanus]|uniref:Predicted arabinose efflux permease, MFS family n=1 Tax=Streptoalloteichus hindustanus TaxID=2017 RepID=A0A1M5DQC2_STRHI|nr:MFS transporter [Streptoalloteichus hindustanus]SHF69189.1 Predicted arabinose efflux permease, MFS family [Streptoalloteichus hindustanus]